MTYAAPRFEHLRHLSDALGLHEHALLSEPRPEHGYCLDDVARALVVVCRTTGRDGAQLDLVEQYLSFVLAAQQPDGAVVNRRSVSGDWNGDPSLEDCWGRSLWGLGAVVSGTAEQETRDRALAAFETGAAARSPYLRAMAYAGIGAAEVLAVMPEHAGARTLLRDAADRVCVPGPDPRWPEARLEYANALLPEVLIAAGALLDDAVALERGLAMLTWLLASETSEVGHLSVTPVGGRELDERAPGGDQQPIEVAALADACARAHGITGDQRWADATMLAASWFFGSNDSGVRMIDLVSGGGWDGLEAGGRNENQGAESTLAVISTLQQARRVFLSRV